MISTKLLLLTAILLPLLIQAQFSCRDNSNNQVDWFAALKYPGNVTGGHGYIDSVVPQNIFSVLPGHADDNGGALSNTIDVINSMAGLSLLVYNDEPPASPTVYTGAHAKGFIAWDQSSGRAIYVMHSVPKYPNVSADGKITAEVNRNAYTYGQNFFCVNLEISDLTTLHQNLQTVQLTVFYSSGAFSGAEWLPVGGPDFTVNDFKVSNGDTITMLSKSPDYNQFLYEGIIEPHYQTGLQVESWGRPYQNPECAPQSGFDSTNVNLVRLSNGDSWQNWWDHSKWAVSFDATVGIACPADMNRMASQITRGGSAFCYKNAKLYNAYKSIVSQIQQCSDNENVDSFLSA